MSSVPEEWRRRLRTLFSHLSRSCQVQSSTFSIKPIGFSQYSSLGKTSIISVLGTSPHSLRLLRSSSLLVRGVVEPEIMFSNQEAILGNFIVLSKHGDAVSVTSGEWRSLMRLNLHSLIQARRRATSTPTCSAPSSTTRGTWSSRAPAAAWTIITSPRETRGGRRTTLPS